MADYIADDELAAKGRSEFSGVLQISKLPRRGLDRSGDIVQRADPGSAPRKSSQANDLGPKTGKTVERESGGAKEDAINFHRRDTSSVRVPST
jgi:hypothetical protein